MALCTHVEGEWQLSTCGNQRDTVMGSISFSTSDISRKFPNLQIVPLCQRNDIIVVT